MEKIGILGGSFDPVHIGHLLLAQQAKEEAALSRVIFIPAKVQPFKQNVKTTEENKRYAMVSRAISGNPDFLVSSIELEKMEISYTLYTLRACREQFGDACELFFIMGTDSFLTIEKWYQAEMLLREFSFIVGFRPGYLDEELKGCLERIRETYHTNVIPINNRRIEISSSDVRQRVKENKSIRYLVPKEVEEYIYDSGLYL